MSCVREQILNSALNLFVSKGYSDVSMRDIVEAVGVSKGAFYHYFPSKAECFKECLRFLLDKLNFDNFSGFPKHNLREFLDTHFSNLREKHRGFDTASDVYSFIHDAMKRVPELPVYIENQRRSELEVWVEVVQNALTSGEITSHLSAVDIAKLFIYVSDGAVINMLILNYTHDDLHNSSKVLWDKLYSLLKSN